MFLEIGDNVLLCLILGETLIKEGQNVGLNSHFFSRFLHRFFNICNECLLVELKELSKNLVLLLDPLTCDLMSLVQSHFLQYFSLNDSSLPL